MTELTAYMMLGLASRGFCGKDLRSSRRSLELSRGVSRAGSHRAPRAHARRIRPACAPPPHPHIHIPHRRMHAPRRKSEPLLSIRTWNFSDGVLVDLSYATICVLRVSSAVAPLVRVRDPTLTLIYISPSDSSHQYGSSASTDMATAIFYLSQRGAIFGGILPFGD